MIFLDCVNRIFRSNGIIRGDDDAITSFNDTAHNASIQLCQIAVQDELNSLVSDRFIDSELNSGTINTVASTRTYSLASDFVRFYGTPQFYYQTGNRYIREYPGGRSGLSDVIPTYKTDSGEPHWWYWEPSSTKSVGFFHVPNAVFQYTYDYEKNVSVAESSDALPFASEQEAQVFTQCAARRFKALRETTGDVVGFLNGDTTYATAKATLANFLKPRNPYTRYAAVIR